MPMCTSTYVRTAYGMWVMESTYFLYAEQLSTGKRRELFTAQPTARSSLNDVATQFLLQVCACIVHVCLYVHMYMYMSMHIHKVHNLLSLRLAPQCVHMYVSMHIHKVHNLLLLRLAPQCLNFTSSHVHVAQST